MNLTNKWPLIVFGALLAIGISGATVWLSSQSDVTELNIEDGKIVSIRSLADSKVQKICFFPSYSWGKEIDCSGDRWVRNPDVPVDTLFFTVISDKRCRNYSIAAEFGLGLNDIEICMKGDQANNFKMSRKGRVVFLYDE